MKRYRDKVVAVTGGGLGIGRAIARRLADEGAALALFDVNAENLAGSTGLLQEMGAKVETWEVDVADEAGVAAAFAAAEHSFGRIDVLVNNAAFTIKGSVEQTEPADWDREVAVTLKGPYLCARAVLPGMVRRNDGAIVNIGSVNGLTALGNPAYSAAKAGLRNFTQALATEYGPRGIRANMVSPGTVRTEAPTWRIRQEKDPAIFDKLARWYPVGRVGVPDDIAAAVAFLGAEEAGFVNGANLVVDGGLTAGLGVMIDELTLESK